MTIEISFAPERLDLDVIHHFLSSSYWATDIPRETVARAVAGSFCVGAYDGAAQIGFARAVTDQATFAYLADVFVLPAYRGRGIARDLVRALHDHADLQGLRRWLLVTSDAQPLYAGLGWTPITAPDMFMQRHFPDVYAR